MRSTASPKVRLHTTAMEVGCARSTLFSPLSLRAKAGSPLTSPTARQKAKSSAVVTRTFSWLKSPEGRPARSHVLEGDAVLFEHLGYGAGEGELVGHVFHPDWSGGQRDRMKVDTVLAERAKGPVEGDSGSPRGDSAQDRPFFLSVVAARSCLWQTGSQATVGPPAPEHSPSSCSTYRPRSTRNAASIAGSRPWMISSIVGEVATVGITPCPSFGRSASCQRRVEM